MGILTIIVIGAIVGWIASRVMGRDEGFIASILIGIVGSFIGSLLSRMLIGSDQALLAFSWSGFFWSLIGAIILVAIMNAMSHPKHRDSAI